MASGLQGHINDALQFVFPENCFEELLIKFNILHPTCPKMVLSRVLGLGITAGSLMLFIPQILKIFAAKSGKGISLLAQILALVGSAGTAAYSYKKGFVFSQWGDSLFVAIQLVLIVAQIMYYNKQTLSALLFTMLSGVAAFAVYDHRVPIHVLTAIQASGIPIVFVSKGLQAWQNYTAQSTGQLSLISCFLQFAGCLARVFTSVQDTGDQLLIFSFLSAAVLNGIIFAQFFLYWKTDDEKKRR